MYFPPNYMNYGQPLQYIAQPIAQQPYPPSRVPFWRRPLWSFTRFCHNWKYIIHPLGIIRLLLILSTLGAVTAASKVQNVDFAQRQESAFDNSVWISALVFSIIGLLTSILIYLLYICNIPFIPGFRLIPWSYIFALFDALWAIPMIILGSFAGRREHVNQVIGGDFRNRSINKGAFAVLSAMAVLSGALFIISALLHYLYGRKYRNRLRMLNQVPRRY